MSCWITFRTDRVKYVKNLGWLRRHWQKIENLTVEREPSQPNSRAVRLTAHIRWGHSSDRYGERMTFTCIFSDITVLRGHFLDRPVFRGLWVKWMGKGMQVGSAEYRAMDVLAPLLETAANGGAETNS